MALSHLFLLQIASLSGCHLLQSASLTLLCHHCQVFIDVLIFHCEQTEGRSWVLQGDKTGPWGPHINLRFTVIVNSSWFHVIIFLVVALTSNFDWYWARPNNFIANGCWILVFLLFPDQTGPKIVQTRLIEAIPLLKFRDSGLKMRNKWVDGKMITHHFFMMDSALIRIFSLNKKWESSEESPRLKVILLIDLHEVVVICQEYCVFDDLLFRPIVSPGGNGYLCTKGVCNFKRSWAYDFHFTK